ncbi:MAG: ATPase involved in DNA repair SbcC [Candidatus Methanohalarchaeum thermophilum]|uniref:ATPase involved in DNA repair SbcC n=1 Tax=Methanohalarchaeum thermophilum TaxID=1903181 RepID=A0A1Q6DWJ2_METT1|nr:MAG: ATPase involved in DNA repair SbcC [Candidatus Methanohalarchaeum thermophilum]
MKVNWIQLKNIRSYDEERVQFPNGPVLLSGDVGHGKSSLLMGLEFALFGLRGKQLTSEDLLREGEKRAEVKANFSVNDKNYTIKRGLKRGNKRISQVTGYIKTEGTKKELSPRDLKREIFKILGYPMEMVAKRKSLIYRYTVYTPQEEMKEIVKADADDRLNTLRKVIGINKYKRIRENISEIKNTLRDPKKKLSGIYNDLEQKKENKQELENEVKNLKNKLKNLREKRDNKNKKLDEWKEKKEEIEEKIEAFHKLDKQKNNLKNEIKNKENKIKELEKKEKTLKKEVDEFKKLDRPTSKKLDEIKEKIKELEEKKENYLKSKKDISEKINNLLRNKKELEEEIKDIKKEIDEKIAEKKTIRKNLNDLKEAQSECPVCGHTLTKQHRKNEIKQKKKQIKNLQKDQKQLKNKKENKNTQKQEIQTKIKEKQQKAIKETKKQIKTLKKEKENLRKYKEKKKTAQDKKEKIKENKQKTKNLKKEKQKVTKKLQETKEKLQELKDIKEKQEKINKKLEKTREELKNIEKDISSKKSEHKTKTKTLKKHKKEIKEKEKAKSLEKEINKKEEWLKNLGTLSSTIESQFMLKLQKQFNSIFNNWFNTLVEEDELDVRVNEKFTPIIERRGEDTKYRKLSGGERTSVALAYRLALNSVINSLIEDINTQNFIILDEPTDGFSTEQLDKIRDIINQLKMNQIIIVSHEPKIESYVDNVINIYKQNGTSTTKQQKNL